MIYLKLDFGDHQNLKAHKVLNLKIVSEGHWSLQLWPPKGVWVASF